MVKKKVLFSHSYYYPLDVKQWNNKTPYPPLGTVLAAAVMREKGYHVSLFDTNLCFSPDAIFQKLNQSPDYFVLYDDGFNYLTKMCLTTMREAAFEMIGYAKKLNIPVFVSSSDSTDHFEKYLDAGATAVMLGEAEETLTECLEVLDKGEGLHSNILGLAFRENGKTIRTASRKVLKNLDDLPLPAWDLVDVDAYKAVWKQGKYPFHLNLATTRGCPFKCNWCAKPIYGNKYNSRSPEHVIKEIELLKKEYDVSTFWMCDDIFGLKPGWVKKFNTLLKEKGIRIQYKIQSRADLLVKENTIESLSESGLYEVWIGAESGSQRVLDAMDKGTTLGQIKESTQKLQDLGVRVAYFIQYGYLGETAEEIQATLKMIATNKPDDIGVSVSYPLPGTPFYDQVKKDFEAKQNWADSDDLAMMFQGTFNSAYYKILHRYTHKVFRAAQAKRFLAKGLSGLSTRDWRTLVAWPVNEVLKVRYKGQLRHMKNTNS